MDLETENRIASVLLREAAELRRQAEKDGVRAYLEKPNFSVGEVSGGGFRCGSDDLRGCGGRRGEEQNNGVMGGKKLLQQEDLLALRPSSCSACLLQ
ncbi:hypothetical protein YC2023_109001 [Brassica napus]